jgi:hypothetical protein
MPPKSAITNRNKTVLKMAEEQKTKRAKTVKIARGTSSTKKAPVVQKGKRNITQKKEPSKSSLRRQKKREERVTTEKLNTYLRTNDVYKWSDYDNMDPVNAFQSLFGFHPDVNLFMSGVTIYKSAARQWLERAGAQQQCNNVIGGFRNGTICYICGLPIQSGNEECEHVLAVFKAAMYLHLYRDDYKPIFNPSGKITEILDSAGRPLDTVSKNTIKRELELEYRWAHRCCNQVKSDRDFIKFDGDEFSFDIKESTQMLKDIVANINKKSDICKDSNLQKHFRDLKLDTKEKISKWITKKLEVLQGIDRSGSIPDYAVGAVSDIIDYLNGKHRGQGFGQLTAKENKGAFMLTSLAKVIAAADTSEVLEVWRYQQGLPPPVQEVPIPEAIEKAEIHSNMVKILTNLLAFDWGRTMNVQDIHALYLSIMERNLNPNEINATRNNDNPNFKKQIIAAGLLSLQKQNDVNPLFKDFFRNMIALLLYPPNNHEDLGSISHNVYKASDIAGIGYSLLILSNYLANALNSAAFNNNSGTPIMLQFIQKFKTELTTHMEKLVNALDHDLNRFLNIFLYLVQRIYPDKFHTLKELLIPRGSEFVEQLNEWTNLDNLHISTVKYIQDYNPTLHETPTVEFTGLQEIARDATMLLGIRNIPSE